MLGFNGQACDYWDILLILFLFIYSLFGLDIDITVN